MRTLPTRFLAVIAAMAAPLFASSVMAQLVRPNAIAPSNSAPAASPAPAKAQKSSAKVRASKKVELAGDQIWVDTGIDVQAGERMSFAANGTLTYSDPPAPTSTGPQGAARGFKDLLRILPLNSAGRGALIGRVGDADTSQAFLVGASKEVVATTSGRLWVGINQDKNSGREGSYSVQIEVYAPKAAPGFSTAKDVSSLSGIDKGLFAKIPRRIEDKDGDPGDMVNFLILGSEDAMKNVFASAGWVKVDADVKDTILHGVLQSMAKESYLTMPMSQLYLFGRPQDYGWAHAEPISVVASRNHLRIWKAPFTVKGETLWVGAATHDIGFERDQRNNGVTHKIDPDIDAERAFVEKTLTSTGLVSDVTYFLPESPLKEAHTATGGTFHSNGQVLVLKLSSAAEKPATTASNP
jgi:hypothetical protein